MAKISLKNVSTICSGEERRGEGMAVRDVSFEIENRALVVLTGPRGCGKTALLRIIAGLDEVSNGDVLIGDRRVNDLKPNDRDVAMVFRDEALYPEMSARQNIAFGLTLRKFSKTEITRRVQDSAAILGIEDLLERRPRQLSTAQRQRVSIARAIARQPKVLLFDEPLSNLDVGERPQMRADIRKLHDRLQATVVYATADASEAMVMGERLVVLNNGSVQQNDSPQTVYDAPANLLVAGFLGAPPMNFVHGTLKQERDSLLFSEEEEGTIQMRILLSERPAIGGFAGKKVVLGIRPEDVQILNVAKGHANAAVGFPAVIDLVETMGAETNLSLLTGAHTIVGHSSGTLGGQPIGRRVRFQFNLRKAHLFDPASTLRIGEP